MDTIKCPIEGCEKEARKRESYRYCGMHAQRVRRYGDPHYTTPESVRRIRLRAAQPKLGIVKVTTYPKFHGRHEHRVVAEKMLGRPLAKGEIVHHIDGNKHNNAPENLQVMTQSEHMKEHREEMRVAHLAAASKNSIQIVVNGVSHSIGEWAKITGLSRNTIYGRMLRGRVGEIILEKK